MDEEKPKIHTWKVTSELGNKCYVMATCEMEALDKAEARFSVLMDYKAIFAEKMD